MALQINWIYRLSQRHHILLRLQLRRGRLNLFGIVKYIIAEEMTILVFEESQMSSYFDFRPSLSFVLLR